MSGNVSKLCHMKIGDFVCLLSDVHALSELPWTALMFLDFRATAVTLWHWVGYKLQKWPAATTDALLHN